MKILYLTLEKKWFDMILSGEKTEEYREIKEYWRVRLVNPEYRFIGVKSIQELAMPNDLCKQFDRVVFTNGYSKTSRRASFQCNYIGVDMGYPEWGAEEGKSYFVIKLGSHLTYDSTTTTNT